MKLSVIIPVFNGADTIAFAIESVLYQNVNFDFEIIAYDDCSTDNTKNIIQSYAARFPCVKYHANRVNGGNAETFYNATKESSGEYLHVLDADDFFTSWNKLQKQVDFLDNHPDYCAVAHESIKLSGDSININGLNKAHEATHPYEYDAEKLFGFYYHTSTFMYKNVFKNDSCEVLKNSFCRGDEIRIQLVLAITNEKIKNLGLIGSVYNYHGKGLWSSMSPQEQLDYSMDCLRKKSELVFSGLERRAICEKVKKMEVRSPKEKNDHGLSLGDSLDKLHRILSKVTNADPVRREELFQNCNYFPQADEQLEAIGRICLFKKRLLLIDRQYDRNCYLFTVSGFKTDQGGGIIREIREFVGTFLSAGKRVFICSTENVATDQKIIDTHFSGDNLKFIRANGKSRLEKLEFLVDEICAIRPERMYPFVSHNDVIGAALIQKHLAAEIIMSWVYDHGTSLAVSNSSITSYIAKNSSYHYTLKSIWKHNKINIVPVSFDQNRERLYVPFKNHSRLITATASARSYKVETKYKFSYIDIVTESLRQTGGKHYHYGPLPDTFKNHLLESLEAHRIGGDSFVHIEWVEDLSWSLISNEVDLFLSSFPVGSVRIAVEVNSIGVPILSHRSINRLFSLKGFISPDNYWWENPGELFSVIESLNAEDLSERSKKVREFYESNNGSHSTRPLLLNNESIPFAPETVIPKSFVKIPIQGTGQEGLNSLKKLRYKMCLCLHAIPLVGSSLIGEERIGKCKKALVP